MPLSPPLQDGLLIVSSRKTGDLREVVSVENGRFLSLTGAGMKHMAGRLVVGTCFSLISQL